MSSYKAPGSTVKTCYTENDLEIVFHISNSMLGHDQVK